MLFNMTRTWKDSIQQAEILSYGYGTLIQKRLISNEIALPGACLYVNVVHIAFLVMSVHWNYYVVRLDCSTLDLLWTDSLHIRVVKLPHRVDIYISPNGSEIIHYICLSKTCRGLKFGLTPLRVLEQWLIKGFQKSCFKLKLALHLNLTMQIPYMHQLFTYNILLIDPYYHETFISYL